MNLFNGAIIFVVLFVSLLNCAQCEVNEKFQVKNYLLRNNNAIKCPSGQEPDSNGGCPQIRNPLPGDLFVPNGVIEVPGKCPPGQKPDENGNCQEIWDSLKVHVKHINDVEYTLNGANLPRKCQSGVEHDKTDDKGLSQEESKVTFGVIDVPGKCPPGQKPDENGNCQVIWDSSVNNQQLKVSLNLQDELLAKDLLKEELDEDILDEDEEEVEE